MKKKIFLSAGLLLVVVSLSLSACKKDNKASSTKSEKYRIVAGAWKQSDIVLGVAVSVKVGATKYNFPAGTSVITDPILTAAGVTANFTSTKNSVYRFSDSGSYRIDGVTTLILPVAGNKGRWSLDVYDAVLKLNPADTTNDPHWINAISDTSLALAMTVTIPGLGAAPLSLQLKKQ